MLWFNTPIHIFQRCSHGLVRFRHRVHLVRVRNRSCFSFKVPCYTVFYQFHTAVRGPTTPLPCLLRVALRETMPLTLVVECANVYGGCIAEARRDAVVQPYRFEPESDPEGEAPEEYWLLTLQLQQDASERLMCLNNISLFYVLLQLLPCS